MVAKARRKLKARSRSRRAVFHCTVRCVRRAFLCGRDPVSGHDYSHRRDWILIREEQLVGLFAIEVEFRCEMRNHLHVILRTCPEIARRLSDEEVARRWLTITWCGTTAGTRIDAAACEPNRTRTPFPTASRMRKKSRSRSTDPRSHSWPCVFWNSPATALGMASEVPDTEPRIPQMGHPNASHRPPMHGDRLAAINRRELRLPIS